MRGLFFIALSLFSVLCSSFVAPKYFVEVLVPFPDSCWGVLHYDKQMDSVYLKKCYSFYEETKYDKAFPVSQFPSIKKIYKYNFKELEKLCEHQENYNFPWEKDACIIIKHVGCFASAYKLKLSGKGTKQQEKLKKLIVQLK